VSVDEPWTRKYKPKSRSEIVGNSEAVEHLQKWISSWKKGPPKKRAAFVYGPPGIGKTSTVQVLARELDYDLMEVNASDSRSKSKIEEILGKSSELTVNVFGQSRMILLDEMEGVSGQQDRGGITAISDLLKTTLNPIVMVATTVGENMQDKFRPLLDKAVLIEFQSISSKDLCNKLILITKEEGVTVHPDALEMLAMKSGGDLRSAINDLEAVARGKTKVQPEDVSWLKERDRQDTTPNLINKIFSAKSFWEARRTISQSMIPYEDLFDWIYENLPLIIDDREEQLEALEMMAKADVYQNRAKNFNYRLLKYMFNLMTGGVALSRKQSKGLGIINQVQLSIKKVGLSSSGLQIRETKEGVTVNPTKWLGREKWGELNSLLRKIGGKWVYGQNVWIIPYIREPQSKWRYITTYHDRRRMKAIAEKLAQRTHTSTQEAITETMPLLKVIYRANQENANMIVSWLELEPKEQEYLSS
jgi:replication factor C large subunit